MSADPAPLTLRQQRFCEEYLVDCCAAKAARRAGYSPKCAKQEAHVMLQLPAVQAEIAQLQAERRAQLETETVEIERELRRLAFGTKTADKARLRALELLGKQRGMFVDKHEVTGANGSPIPLEVTVRFVSAST